MDQQDDNRGNQPAMTLRDGSLKAVIWENEGEKGPYFSTQLAKTYEDRDGKLRDTHSFSGTELLRVAELARQAYGASNELRLDRNQAPERDPQAEFDQRDRAPRRNSGSRQQSRAGGGRDRDRTPRRSDPGLRDDFRAFSL